ncbi:hypothetical protein [Arthrobacter sp. efr-133-TYG-104]|uniref:hypothetical protein n=1 Tax=Arthrobacter sp. efr-133-TYG-104 TaxID=3040324 RepID=UPI00254F3FBA|nr:hypothetical protein [Arthrobacter sp. efr-133-TYG-104]
MAKLKVETPSRTTNPAPHITATLLAVFALLVSILTALPAQAAGAPPVYPISGYFIYGSTNDATNMSKLTDIKSVGGDTIITFGSLLKPATLASVPASCTIGGVNCAAAATSGVKVNRYFTYSDGNSWGAPALICPRDKTVTSGNTVYTILVFPTLGTTCTSSNGLYDVVVINGGTTSISVSVAKAATTLGMKYYTGMPAPVKRTDITYLVDLSYQSTLTAFTNRFLQYEGKVNNVPGLAGFYHHTEMPLSDSPIWAPVLDVYKLQNAAIRKYMPTRAAVISPYLDTRIASAANITPDEAGRAIADIAATANGVSLAIAVQDGMGTGKTGAFFGNESGSSVDQYAASVVGSGSWGSKYLAPNRDYFAAMADGVDGTGTQLWANLEGMAPATSQNPCDTSLRGQTTKPRVDRQLQQLGNSPTKIISFMWDPYYTCTGTFTPMFQRMKTASATPVITDSIFYGNGDVLVTGENLSGGTVQVRWTDVNGQTFNKTVPATSYNPNYGTQQGINPRIESVMASLGNTSLGSGKYYLIDVLNGAGMKNDAPYSDQG